MWQVQCAKLRATGVASTVCKAQGNRCVQSAKLKVTGVYSLQSSGQQVCTVCKAQGNRCGKYSVQSSG